MSPPSSLPCLLLPLNDVAHVSSRLEALEAALGFAAVPEHWASIRSRTVAAMTDGTLERQLTS